MLFRSSRSAAGVETSGSRGASSRTIDEFMAPTIARKSAGRRGAGQREAAGLLNPPRRTRSRPKGSSQLVITSHLLAIHPLQPHRHLAVERIPIDIALHRGRLALAMALDDQVILRDTRIRQYLGYRLSATP